MSPDRAREKEVEPLAEDGRVEAVVELEPGTLVEGHPRLEEVSETQLDAATVGLDPEVAARREEVDQPVARAEDAAADVDHSRLAGEPQPQQGRELEPAALLEVVRRHTEKAAVARHAFGACTKR